MCAEKKIGAGLVNDVEREVRLPLEKDFAVVICVDSHIRKSFRCS